MSLILYPKRPVKKDSFKGSKVFTVPNQSMTLKEVLKRFVKHESLPVSHEGIYYEGEHDLEKLVKADPVDQEVVKEQLRVDTAVKKEKADKVTAMENAKKEARKKKEAEFDAFIAAQQKDPKP